MPASVRKILHEQLQLLAEASKKCQENNELQLLAELTRAMVELAKYC